MGVRISWLCNHHLHLGWLAYFQMRRIKKKQNIQQYEKNNPPQTQ